MPRARRPQPCTPHRTFAVNPQMQVRRLVRHAVLESHGVSCGRQLPQMTAVRAAVGSWGRLRPAGGAGYWAREVVMPEAFTDLPTPLLADACVRCGVPLRAAHPGIRPVVA